MDLVATAVSSGVHSLEWETEQRQIAGAAAGTSATVPINASRADRLELWAAELETTPNRASRRRRGRASRRTAQVWIPLLVRDRTVLDLAAIGVSRDRLAAAMDSALRLHLSAPLVLTDRLAQLRGPGRYGVRLLDQLLIDSGGEKMLDGHCSP